MDDVATAEQIVVNPAIFGSIAIALVLAITLHEAAHAWVADKLGDPTPREQGRVTLNPIRHISFFGTIVLPSLLLLLQVGILFGWAKPVLVEPRNFKNPKIAMMDVALAGPAMNIALALLGCVGLALTTPPDFVLGDGLRLLELPMLQGLFAFTILINCVLAVFNMLPLPPLDGSKVLIGLLPHRLALPIARAQGYGFALLIMLLVAPMFVPGAPNPIFWWIAKGTQWIMDLMLGLFGLA